MLLLRSLSTKHPNKKVDYVMNIIKIMPKLLRSAVEISHLQQRALLVASVVRYSRYLDTYRRYLRDDTSIANVTIYRGISWQYKIP